MSERKVTAPFLTKTYQLVDDPATDDVVSWNESGTTFVVWKTADFAKDLLPNYFKHCNFSSFVRQLNTYGFKKIVVDRWEFANEKFKRGEQELLAQMRRRKTVPTGGGKPTVANPTSLVNSGDDQGSTSTSSPDSKNPGSLDTPVASQFANLSDENEKLRKENKTLSSELTQMQKQCDELIVFLTKHVNIGHDQIHNIMKNGSNGYGVVGELTLNWNGDNDVKFRNNGHDDDDEKLRNNGHDDDDDDDDEIKGGDQGLKLFGVLLKGKEKKRGRDENNNNSDFDGLHCKNIKTATWLRTSSDKGNKVCN